MIPSPCLGSTGDNVQASDEIVAEDIEEGSYIDAFPLSDCLLTGVDVDAQPGPEVEVMPDNACNWRIHGLAQINDMSIILIGSDPALKYKPPKKLSEMSPKFNWPAEGVEEV